MMHHEAAVFRPQTGYYSEAVAEAAALFESLVENHPFLDKKKRTALAADDVHLRMHGFELAGESLEHHDVIITLMSEGDLD
jgi:death-on-curing protein